jgi:cysteine synthase A
MPKIYKNILETIGNTPLVKINRIANGLNIFAKIESRNPGGSVKDRIAKKMLDDAESSGLLKPGMTIVEPTSGNTGIGLALVAAVKGYKLILTMPESMSNERKKLLRALGAELVLTPAELGMNGAVKKAQEIAQAINAFIPSQFDNPSNPNAHSQTTALEIWNDSDGLVDTIVAGAGTGGTITGIARALKQKKNIHTVAVEPAESPVLSGGKPGTHKIQGIGPGFIPKIIDRSLIDEIIAVSSENAIQTARRIAKEEGIIAGISSGAALYAALQYANRHENKNKFIVVIFPDTGERYLSTGIYD